ncbi:class III lanthionine synthetase LanKC [Nonomuraea sp. NBC_01738]|uniref:class III lanthionine synthetase LanKC n=1 Tax=Nonomuraea sp. NBC_01738 TaxID=2976003 RepID=UPI002E106698|nr:class III lanthionine synthetase LanKC [Nonomuraea sp. NBC_01738]
MTTHQQLPPEFSAPDMFPTNREYTEIVEAVLGDDWTITPAGSWHSCSSPRTELIAHGWKIHVSSIPPHARQVLDLVARYCAEHDVAFKFARDPLIHGLMNGKHWPRAGAGKFITVYPDGTESFRSVLAGLRPLLTEFRGPYILSDRRYLDSSCLYYRYGGIDDVKRVGPGGSVRHVLATPDGAEYEDERNPYYVSPPWAEDPFGPEIATERPDGPITLNSGRYEVSEALAHTTRGGTYLALDTVTGAQVVIKEARPHTEWIDGIGDAVAQLGREARALEALEASGVTPRRHDVFQEWEHHYLVEDFVEGSSLGMLAGRHLPPHFLRAPGTADRDDYLRHSIRLWRAAMTAMDRVHALGYVIGDISPFNIIVSDDLATVRFIDLEGAVPVGEQTISVRTPGFSSADDGGGQSPATIADDYYGLAATLLSLLLATAHLVTWAPETFHRLLTHAADRSGIEAQLREMIAIVTARRRPDPAAVTRLRRDLMRPAETTAPPTAAGRLALPAFRDGLREALLGSLRYPANPTAPVAPADREVFATNRYCAGYGAAGVLRGLEAAGAKPDDLAHWLTAQDLPARVSSPGLYTGLAGIAWTLHDRGDHDAAAALIDLSVERAAAIGGDVSLYSGAAGIGLACLHVFQRTGDERRLRQAVALAEPVHRALATQTAHDLTPGLAGGSAGLALFLLYLSLATGEPRHSEAGRRALTTALDHTVPIREGDGLQARIDPAGAVLNRFAPFWDAGAAGLGTVCLRYGVALDDDDLRATAHALARGCEDRWVNWPTFANGLAGMGMYLLDCAHLLPGEAARWQRAAEETAGLLTLFRVDWDGRLHLPGVDMRTVSGDLLTGAAGALLFVTRALESGPNLMFLPDDLLPGTTA